DEQHVDVRGDRLRARVGSRCDADDSGLALEPAADSGRVALDEHPVADREHGRNAVALYLARHDELELPAFGDAANTGSIQARDAGGKVRVELRGARLL